jgi:hypothetical protein
MSHPLDDLPTLRDFRDQLVAAERAEATPVGPQISLWTMGRATGVLNEEET